MLEFELDWWFLALPSEVNVECTFQWSSWNFG